MSTNANRKFKPDVLKHSPETDIIPILFSFDITHNLDLIKSIESTGEGSVLFNTAAYIVE